MELFAGSSLDFPDPQDFRKARDESLIILDGARSVASRSCSHTPN